VLVSKPRELSRSKSAGSRPCPSKGGDVLKTVGAQLLNIEDPLDEDKVAPGPG